MSKIAKKRKFMQSYYPNFGYCDKIDENSDFALTWYYNCFRNELKEWLGIDNLNQDLLKSVRYTARQFCDTQAMLFQTPKYYFSSLVSQLMLAIDSNDNELTRARIIDLLCREYHKLRKNKLIKKHTRNPMWKMISYLTIFHDNKLVLFNILGILYFYEI